jgi:hypothetical protein
MVNFALCGLALHSLVFPADPFPALLSRPLRLTSTEHIRGAVYQRERIVFSFTDAIIECCQFIRVKNPNSNGGSVMSFASLVLLNCLFDQCEGRDGGAIACHSGLLLIRSTFRRCFSKQSGGIDLRSHSPHATIANLTLFQNCRSDYFGSFYRCAPTDCNFTALNFSHSRAQHCVGCLESKTGRFWMTFTGVTAASSGSHNGGVCVREIAALTIAACAFDGCQHTSTEDSAGAALLVYDCPSGATLTGSQFTANRPDGSYTLTVASGNVLHIHACCFTGAMQKEVNGRLVRADACEFSARRCRQIEILSGGFDLRVTARSAVIEMAPADEKAATVGEKAVEGRQKAEIIVAASALLSVVSAIMMATIHLAVQKCCKSKKLPRAFQ